VKCSQLPKEEEGIPAGGEMDLINSIGLAWMDE